MKIDLCGAALTRSTLIRALTPAAFEVHAARQHEETVRAAAGTELKLEFVPNTAVPKDEIWLVSPVGEFYGKIYGLAQPRTEVKEDDE